MFFHDYPSAGRPSEAPELADSTDSLAEDEERPWNKPSTSGRPGGPPPPSSIKGAWRQVLRQLSNLKLAIGELAVIASLSSIGTVVEQGKPYQFYLEQYPDDKPYLGFITHRLIWALQWDHIYTADYFLGLLVLLGASLAACTYTNQWPSAKVAQRWRFRTQPEQYTKLETAVRLSNARVQDIGRELSAKRYQVFIKDGSLYAFKGLAGKLGPIGVHASMLAIMAGVAVGALGGYNGSALIPEGGDAVIGSLLQPASPMGRLPAAGEALLHVDDFTIDYRTDGSIRQFFTEVTVQDFDGKILARKTISVNQPLRYGGVTAYQTDWGMAALTIKAKGSPLAPADGSAVNLPMAMLQGETGSDSKLFATFLPAEDPSAVQGKAPRGVSILARDLQSVVFYDSKGEFVGVRRPGSGKPITVEGVEIVVEGIVASSGMELKSDPGVPIVYAGFGGLCITAILSYLSHSQVWAWQEGGNVLLGGRTNRAKYAFTQELGEVARAVPEVLQE